MKSNYNVVVSHQIWAKLRPFLIEKGVNYEPSGYYDDIYVSLWITEEESRMINAKLDEIYEEG